MRPAWRSAIVAAALVLALPTAARAQDSARAVPSPGAAPPAAAPAAPDSAGAAARATVPTRGAGAVVPPSATPVPEALHESTQKPLESMPPGARASGPSRMCGVCHSDIRVKFDKGIHKAEEIGCTSCHGGNPTATTVATAHLGNGYRGKPRRRDIPHLCASCHSDVARMQPYNLPSDQYRLYQSSRHGIALAKGDESVAVCTDCHGVHEIRPAADPVSAVARRNVPATCGRCHSDTALMRRHGRRDNPLADYKEGAHGTALLVEGNNAAPECANCHGSHATEPPGFGDVDKVCGQCHGKTRTYFLASAHRGSIEKDGRSECAACHENHKTAKTDARMLDTVCADCHAAGTPEATVAHRMKTMLTEASTELNRARRLVDRAAAIPLPVEDYQSRLEDARTAFLETVPVTHTLDTNLVEPHVRRARSIAAQVSHEVEEKISGRRWRYVGLGIFWFYLLLTAAIIARARRRAAQEGEG